MLGRLMNQFLEVVFRELIDILGLLMVPRDGIEPSTQGFSV